MVHGPGQRKPIIQADLNGNSVADMQIVLTGINPNLHAADFVL